MSKVKDWLSFILGDKKAPKFDVNAKDKDGDGKVQEGTIFERSSKLTTDGVKKEAKKVATEVVVKTATKVAKEATKVAESAKKVPAKKAPAKKATPKKK